MADEGLEGPDTLVKRPPVLRGLYDQEEEDTEAVDNSMFRQAPEGHLRFTSKTECEAFVRKHCVVGSNPEFPWLQHMFTTLISWEQVQRFIIARMDRYNSLYPVQRVGPPPAKKRERNVYMRQDTGEDIGVPGLDSLAVMDGVRRRLDLPFHK